jgi:hypothetical protein
VRRDRRLVVSVSAELAAFARVRGICRVRMGRYRWVWWPPPTLRQLLDTRHGTLLVALTPYYAAVVRRQAYLAGFDGPLFDLRREDEEAA